MTTTAPPITEYRPTPVREGDDRFVALAAELGARFAPEAARHDRENTFVHENFAALREAGYTRLAVPEELGGFGATVRQVCYAQAELARYCAATALSINMHLYLTLANAYSWRHGATGPERTLRRVASEGLILMASGASDGIWPTATAEKVDGGYRVNGRKIFCSQAPAANVLSTAAVYQDPEDGPVVLAMAIPMTSDGVRIIDTWDTMGMRATASQDVELTDVFVAEAQIAGRRPWGRVDPILRNSLVHFVPAVASVYFGIASGARDEAVCTVLKRKTPAGEPLADQPTIQRQVGLMDAKLKTAWWALLGALDEMGDDYQPDERAANLLQIAKRTVVTHAIEVVDLAMDTVGGSSYFKRSPLERAYRDVRAGKFHPFTPEKALLHAGRLALGLPVDQIW